jgi:dienelactone hydrolase
MHYRAAAFFAAIAVAFTLVVPFARAADAPRALPEDQRPRDERLGALRTVDDYFPFKPVAPTREAWAVRAKGLRDRVLLSQGLWPLPTKTPLEPVIHGKVERDDYTVERVFFQSWPGHFVTGSLYRPKGETAVKRPAVLCPHGHWDNGRFYDAGASAVRRQIAQGAERFERSGRFPLQARCVQLARMGCVVFHYDMLGYADSIQFPEHRPGVRAEMNTPQDWGLFSPQAELRLQNVMGVQTWNSERALDFVLSLPDVDPKRVAVTGASGGATQTLMLAAIDERVRLSFPAVMVSTAMQGGCTCENAPHLRIDCGNIDIAALAAPRPLGMTAADDWTKELMTEGYPDLLKLYTQLGVPRNLFAAAFPQFEHNYNAVSRGQMYNFVNKHFKLDQDEPVIERDFEPLTVDEMTVWTQGHPKPTGDAVGPSHERALVKWMTDDAQRQIDALAPHDEKSLMEFQRVVGGAFDVMIGRRVENVHGPIDYALSDKVDKGTFLQMTGTLTLKEFGAEQLPMLFLHPKEKEKWNGQVVLWLTDQGKAGLLDEKGAPISAVGKLLDAGYSVAGIDLFLQGEFLDKPGEPLTDAPVRGYGDGSKPWQRAACYTFGYNPSVFARRVHDVLTAIKFTQGGEYETKSLHLVGLGPEAGPIAAAARAQAGASVNRCAIDTGGFRFASLGRITHPMFLPGAVKYGDLPALLALNGLAAPRPLRVAGEGDTLPPLVTNAFAAAMAPQALSTGPGGADAAVAWLMRK